MPTMYEYANDFSIKELKSIYSKMRSTFNKRINRLAAVDNSAKIQAFQSGGYKYQRTVADIESSRGRNEWSEASKKKDWANRIAELESLLSARSLSITGRKEIRRDTIQSLQEQGYTGINNKNFDMFTSAMSYFKSIGILNQYDSETIVSAIDTYLDGGTILNAELEEIITNYFSSIDDTDLFN